MKLGLAVLIFAAAMAWLLLSADTNHEARLRLTNVLVPWMGVMAVAGLWVALRAAWREGWDDRTKGIAVLSAMLLAASRRGSTASVGAPAETGANFMASSTDWRCVCSLTSCRSSARSASW